ncbi:MAG: hypothetical protein QXN20_08125 [Candidatus Bathyarchaeia archaeon]
MRVWPLGFMFFLLGVFLRGIPELIVEKYPVGYDTTAHYIFNILNFGRLDVVEMLRQAPLFYLIAYGSIQILGIDVFTLLKISGPVMYGLLCCSLYYFLRRGLGFRLDAATLGGLIFASQLVSLRLSWDMFRLELGLALMFTTIILILRNSRGKGFLVAIFSILTVLAHQMASLTMFFTALWILIRRRSLGRELISDIVPLIPSGVLFTLILYITFLVPSAPDPKIVTLGSSRLFPSYFEIDPRFMEGGYITIVRNIALLMLFCYGLISPLIFRGFKRDEALDPMLVFFSVGSFSPIVFPFISMPAVYWRWILILIIPLSAYSALGLMKYRLLWRRRAAGIILIFTIFFGLAVGYASGTLPLRGLYFTFTGRQPIPPNPGRTGYGPVESLNTYIPATLVASSTSVENITGVIDDCIGSLRWLDRNAKQESLLLAEERFTSWARLYTSEGTRLALYSGLTPIDKVLEELRDQMFENIYLIWYSNVPLKDFREAYRQGSIAIYEYVSE